MIDKTYQPSEVEGRIYRAWEEAGAFRAGRPARAQAETYSIVIPPPNVTGSLHMGHALNNTLQDVLARFERMRGKDVLWQPGTDHAGIATQMVVERQLMERQEPGRREMGREKFLERVWAWKAESGGTIVNQLKRLGARALGPTGAEGACLFPRPVDAALDFRGLVSLIDHCLLSAQRDGLQSPPRHRESTCHRPKPGPRRSCAAPSF